MNHDADNSVKTAGGQQDRAGYLIDRVISKKPEDVAPLDRALLAVELTKYAIDQGKITPQAGLDFANSLIDYNTVPVVVGTSECKVFPIELILKARPAIIDSYRQAARDQGMNLDEKSAEMKDRVQKMSDLLETGADWVDRQYGPFKLSPESIQTEVMSKINTNVAAQEVLTGSPGFSNEQREAATSFVTLNFANFIAGQNLVAHIRNNYMAK